MSTRSSEHREDAVPEPGVRIVAFGDSLTAGQNLSDPSTEAYPALLEKRLRAEGVVATVINSGYSGNTTYDALDRLDFSVPSGTDLVIVAFGANDTFQGKPMEEIETNLREIVRRIKTKGAKVLLAEMKTFPNLAPFYAGKLPELYHKVARDESVVLIPFFLDGVAGVASMNLEDGVHPNARGHQRVAENIYPHLAKALTP